MRRRAAGVVPPTGTVASASALAPGRDSGTRAPGCGGALQVSSESVNLKCTVTVGSHGVSSANSVTIIRYFSSRIIV